MRNALVMVLCAVFIVVGLGLAAAGDPPKMLEKLVFTTRYGNVTFPHLEHARRVKGDCAVCHDALFKMSPDAPLGFKAGMHNVAVKSRSSCARCHAPRGTSFATAGNCTRCHTR